MKLDEARDGLRAVGLWMECRYMGRLMDVPIGKWEMPRQEKGFFTVYLVNAMMECNGFEALAGQKPEVVKAFIRMFSELGAKKTWAYLQRTIAEMKAGKHSGGYAFNSKYYALFKNEKVWIRLFEHLGSATYTKYVLKAQAIQAAGEHTLDPKQWQGDLPELAQGRRAKSTRMGASRSARRIRRRRAVAKNSRCR